MINTSFYLSNWALNLINIRNPITTVYKTNTTLQM